MKNLTNREVRGLRRTLYLKNVKWLTRLPAQMVLADEIHVVI